MEGDREVWGKKDLGSGLWSLGFGLWAFGFDSLSLES